MDSTGKRKAARAAEAEAAEHPPVHNDSLEDIFLRLDAADIARASIACTAFRGVITEPTFRRRFGRLHHPPPLVGFLEFEEGPAALDPRTFHHASTPAARGVAEAADFAFSFLPVPDPGSWKIRDASDGRLLLSSSSRAAATGFVDLVVCDPLHHTYFRIPPVPAHLTADTYGEVLHLNPFLVPLPDPPLPAAGGEEKNKEKEPPLQLQVVWLMQRLTTRTVFVFSSSTGEWRRTSALWPCRREYQMCLESYRLYAYGCFYWTSLFEIYTALKLDLREMKFSTLQLPNVTQPLRVKNFVIVEASGGDLGALALRDNSLDLYCKTTTREGGNAAAAGDWRHSRTVPLPHDNNLRYSIVGAADGYLLLQGYRLLTLAQQRQQEARYFSVKLKTLVIEELPISFNKPLTFVHLYTNFPPLLSLPSVCNEEKAGQDEGVTGEASTSTT